ncbi:MAG: hypothetical protein A2770_00345 [Candidatus Levybacteria bacterium RIFCSPHIGHO2_01_FULL_38_12]|nr:MAG: hypothetical protein A2770_00345 [Candidatus Levybacteria bacterium RIFCSPHIGHO2_01_FULL_38_12]OGH43713.1 MAG: hypothetical protein A3J14_04255 [Candidatus Levybacteria bacterium RIFCSPLOWO2_02_FULL_37_18]
MENARKKAINLYANNAWEVFLSKFKFWEEPYEIVDKIVPLNGTIIDLGCGEGLLSNYLAISSPKRKVIGYELAPERLAVAKKGIKNASFYVGDIVDVSYPNADAVVVFHVLHHLNSTINQEQVLKKTKNSLKKNGKLIIVEVHVKPTIKYIAAWVADHFLVPWVFEKRFYTKAYFRKEREWIRLLKKLGFKIKVTEETSGRPFPNIIFECTLN